MPPINFMDVSIQLPGFNMQINNNNNNRYMYNLAVVVYVVVTAYDFETGRPCSNPEWGPIYYIRLRSLHRAYSSLRRSTLGTRAAEHKGFNWACKLIDGCSLELCLATPSVASSGICHRNKVNSTA